MIDVLRRLRRRPARARKAVGVAALLVAMTYGPFPLTRAVYRANGSIGNELVRQGVFWAFVILPVYEIATIADALQRLPQTTLEHDAPVVVAFRRLGAGADTRPVGHLIAEVAQPVEGGLLNSWFSHRLGHLL